MRIRQLLANNDSAIAISFYTDNSIGVLSSKELSESPITRPMGICTVDGGLCVAERRGINYFREIESKDKGVFLYRQAATKFMGFVDGHELIRIKNMPVLANTLFNCLCVPVVHKDFEVVFQPSFMTELVPEDRIHLNGIAVDASTDTIRYISMFSTNNRVGKRSWKHDKNQGCVWDVFAQKPVITDLSIPHSPRVIDGNLYVCESGKGRVLMRDDNSIKVVADLGSFTRGAIAIDDYILIGTSQIRESSKNKSLQKEHLSINKCGVHLLDRHSHKLLDSHYFEDKKDIFDIQLIKSNRYILTADSKPFRFLHLL